MNNAINNRAVYAFGFSSLQSLVMLQASALTSSQMHYLML